MVTELANNEDVDAERIMETIASGAQ
jgi:hypothetical protein